jgi:myo-inositol-1(or 4)-monophosphatase
MAGTERRRAGNASIDRAVAAAEDAADASGEIIRHFFPTRTPARLATGVKNDLSPVTLADRGAEQAIRAVLEDSFPEDGILGEEFGAIRPGARRRWVVDPIDGTRAFITGRPIFGTLIALVEGGRPVLGLIDQPVTGERWIGTAGRRTIFRGPLGGKIGCRPCRKLADAELSCTSPQMLSAAETHRWRRLARAARRVTWGGDCYAYGLLALGQIDIVAEADMKIWDWAALVPVVEGAGGCITDWQGRPLKGEGAARVLAVGNPALLPQAVAALASPRRARARQAH